MCQNTSRNPLVLPNISLFLLTHCKNVSVDSSSNHQQKARSEGGKTGFRVKRYSNLNGYAAVLRAWVSSHSPGSNFTKP